MAREIRKVPFLAISEECESDVFQIAHKSTGKWTVLIFFEPSSSKTIKAFSIIEAFWTV